MSNIVDYDDYFEEYMGLIYSRIINENKLNNLNTVVEFAPGFRYKVAYALKNINFKGTIYIIDSNKNVLNFVTNKYKSILKDANVVGVNEDLIEAINYLPTRIDLFLANHSIDDMIISKYLENKNLEDAFNNTDKSKDILINCWNELNKEHDILFNLKDRVFNELNKFFKEAKCDFVIMSQYKSGYYMKHKNYAEELSKTVFDKLKTIIDTDMSKLKNALDFDFDDFDVALNEGFSLKENIQHIDNWLAGKYRGE